MYDFVLFILVIVFIVIIITSLVYVTRASVATGGTSDPNLERAHTYLAWTSGILWTTIALSIIGGICLVIFGPEFLPLLGKTTVYIFLFLAVAVAILIGVMAAIAASYIGASSSSDMGDIKAAYDDAIIASVITLGTIILILVGYYITWHTSKAAAQTEAETAAAAEANASATSTVDPATGVTEVAAAVAAVPVATEL